MYLDEVITSKKVFNLPLELEICSDQLSGVFDFIRMGTNTCVLPTLVDIWARRVILLLAGARLAVHISAKLCLVLCPSTDGLLKEFSELHLQQLV